MANGQKATIRDVAKRAGVAVSTASRALSHGSASKATREKVFRAAEELNFVPNPAARQLISGRSNIVAIAIPERTDFIFKDMFVAGILGELSRAFSERRMLPFLALTELQDTESLERLLRDSSAGGVVVLSFHYSRQLAQVFHDFDKPTVFIGRPFPRMRYPYVDVDNEEAAYCAAELLVERGRRNIGIIAGPDDMVAPKQRTMGCVNGLADQGMKPLAVISGEYTAEHGFEACERILEQYPEVDGVFAQSDQIAVGVLHALAKHGRQVPNDVSVIGFDDFPVATMANPKLTTFAQPLHDMAQVIAEMLYWRLEHGEWNTVAQVLPASLIKRDSV